MLFVRGGGAEEGSRLICMRKKGKRALTARSAKPIISGWSCNLDLFKDVCNALCDPN